MESQEKPTLQILLLLGAFIVALALRLIRSGILPLSNMEAEIALQALAVARGSETQFGPHMTYVGLTGFDFYIFASGNFLARFWPGLIGALIVFVPYLFRDRIREWPATILSFVLAISPEMVALSRIIGSPMMAFVSLLLALGFLLHRKPILSGIALAMGLMGGAGFWMGVLILGMSFLISEWLFNVSEIFLLPEIPEKQPYWTRFGVSFGVTLLVVGTGFFLVPAGVSGIFSGLFDFIRGFNPTNQAQLILLPLTLIAYTGEAVIFGIWGGLRGVLVRNKFDMFLLIWWVFGLAFTLLYPASTPADLIWVTLPLWILSARVVFFAWCLPDDSTFMVVVTAVLVVVVSAFLLLALRSLVNPTLDQSLQLNTFIALVGGIVLLVAAILLVNYGWSEDVALPGLLIGLAVVFSAGLISVSVNGTGLAPEASIELWYPEEAYLSPELLQISTDRIISWNASGGTPVEIAVSDYDKPGMQWVLRDFDPVNFVPYLPQQSQPGILITDIEEIPEISNSYRGQALVWSWDVVWEEMTPSQYLNWLITRDAPTIANQIIFWVRTDLMPDDQFSR